MMLTRPCVSSADSATSTLNAPLTLPSLMNALSALVLIEPATPPVAIELGNAMFVVLPSSGVILPPKPHIRPSSRAADLVVRTIRASISTCACGRSSSPISCCALVRPSGMSKRIIVLVFSSTCTSPKVDMPDIFTRSARLLGVGVAEADRAVLLLGHGQFAQLLLGLLAPSAASVEKVVVGAMRTMVPSTL